MWNHVFVKLFSHTHNYGIIILRTTRATGWYIWIIQFFVTRIYIQTIRKPKCSLTLWFMLNKQRHSVVSWLGADGALGVRLLRDGCETGLKNQKIVKLWLFSLFSACKQVEVERNFYKEENKSLCFNVFQVRIAQNPNESDPVKLEISKNIIEEACPQHWALIQVQLSSQKHVEEIYIILIDSLTNNVQSEMNWKKQKTHLIWHKSIRDFWFS